MIQHVFITTTKHPLRKIREADCEIKVCDKMTWAIEPNGTRHLLGTSGFFTRTAAEVRKLGALRKIEANGAMQGSWRLRGIWQSAHDQMDKYRQTGMVH